MNKLQRKIILIIVPAILLTVGYMAIGQQEKKTQTQDKSMGHIMVTPDKLQWTAGPESLPPGSQLAVIEGDPSKKGDFTMRLKLPANYRIPPHWHPIEEHITVLSGTFKLGMGDKFDTEKENSLPAGSFAMMPVKSTHFAWVTEETIIQLHGVGPWGITYVNPQDDPRKETGKK